LDDEAYRLYLEGRYHWNKRTEDGLRKSIATFYQALDQNPNYAPAWAGLADAYQQLGLWGHAPATTASSKAKSAALRAIELDDSLVEAHSTLAVILKDYEWDFSGAERAFLRALDLNPLHAVTHQWYGECLASMGRHTDAIAEITRATDLDPLSATISSTLGRQGFFYARRYDQAIEQLRRTIQTDVTFWIAHNFLGWVYIMQRQFAQALAAFEQAKTLDDNPEPLVGLAYACAVSGEPAKARKYLAALTELGQHRYVAPVNIALVHIGLNETDLAFAWLDKAYADRSQWLSDIAVDPAFDPVRSDPRFSDLLRRMKVSVQPSPLPGTGVAGGGT
jgi:tetratricopeptide (TPR) repeat protein